MSIDVVPCPGYPGCVDLVDSRGDGDADPLHFTAAQWEEFVADIKAGTYDRVKPG
jgi:hypothetical protein